MAATLENLLDALAIATTVGGHLEQLSEPEDGVQRRAQLVAHAGEEAALGLVRAVGLGLGLPAPLDLGLQRLVGVAELQRALAHALFELLRLTLHALVEAGLVDRDGKLRRRFPSNADLLRGELARRSTEAESTNELAASDHGHDHVRVDPGLPQGVDLRTRRQPREVEHLQFPSSESLDIAHELEGKAHARSQVRAVAADAGEPLHRAGAQIEQVHDRARNAE